MHRTQSVFLVAEAYGMSGPEAMPTAESAEGAESMGGTCSLRRGPGGFNLRLGWRSSGVWDLGCGAWSRECAFLVFF